jgi:hypothetical protein
LKLLTPFAESLKLFKKCVWVQLHCHEKLHAFWMFIKLLPPTLQCNSVCADCSITTLKIQGWYGWIIYWARTFFSLLPGWQNMYWSQQQYLCGSISYSTLLFDVMYSTYNM